MSQENVKPEQIQASVAAALSRLRGDAAPPSDAPDAVPLASPAPAQGTTQGTTQGATGMAPGMAGMGARPEPFRAANDLRAEPALRPVQSGAPAQAESEPLAAKEPELPRAMFSRPGPIQAA